MSANDSMGIVFKCLSKGAVDFLVKPIRKNELKNLWQHVWRKCHSSSGSGSESGIQTQKSTKSRSVEMLENDTDSNDEAENGSFDLDDRDGSDNGSGTQNSWSKRTVEVNSPQPMSPWDELADPPDSTCAQVIHSRPEALSATWVPANATRECLNDKDELGNARTGKDLNIGITNVPELEGLSGKVMDGLAASMKDKHLELDHKDNEKMGRNLKLNKETQEDDLKDKDVGYMGDITNTRMPQVESTDNEFPNNPSNIANINGIATYENKDLPSLELSLKQLRDVGENGTGVQERNILRHSDLSAFSRYNAASTANQAPTGNVGSCSPVNNSSEVAKTESMHNLRSKSNSTPNQRSNGSSNNNDMGSSTNNFFITSDTLTDKPINKPAVNAHSCSAFQPVQHGHNSFLQPMVPGKQDAAKATLGQARAMHQKFQVQHHHHHYHHHHHHVLNLQQQQQLLNTDASSLRNAVEAAPECGTSDMVGTPVEGNAANYGSASGSNNGSSGQNGSSTAVVAERTNLVAENETGEKCEIGSGSGSASRSGDHSAQRVAALIKFRQKRKERCFEKKVRYQSRKRLAEQRPRMRGQFVRQDADKTKCLEHIPPNYFPVQTTQAIGCREQDCTPIDMKTKNSFRNCENESDHP
ncbi:Two-component response regulator-like [Datura stramonium]|uniref:Two-component response regulator-like n=1 Tax=Datura stramonium TaxID=4076 RepID=A0ABS8VEK9_DATST|nr:Two-component response regulator-like [Datura stramonium]